MVAVLFVCLGNICRSPAAAELLRHLNARKEEPIDLYVESCGLGSWHIGHLPHEQMQEAAKARGVILSSKAQQFNQSFFDRFDFILAVDQDVMKELFRQAKSLEHKSKIHLITEFSKSYAKQEIPDPLFQGEAAFELVLDMLQDSCLGLLERLRA